MSEWTAVEGTLLGLQEWAGLVARNMADADQRKEGEASPGADRLRGAELAFIIIGAQIDELIKANRAERDRREAEGPRHETLWARTKRLNGWGR